MDELPIIDMMAFDRGEISVGFIPTDDVSRYEKESANLSVWEFVHLVPEEHFLRAIVDDKNAYFAHCEGDNFVLISKGNRFEFVSDEITSKVAKAAQQRFVEARS